MRLHRHRDHVTPWRAALRRAGGVRAYDSLMTNLILTLSLAAAALCAGWLFATWYTADNEPVFGPRTDRRVTFKTVLQNALADVRDVLKLDIAIHWLVKNATALAVFASGLVSMADPTLRQALLDAQWHGLPVGALTLLLVRKFFLGQV